MSQRRMPEPYRRLYRMRLRDWLLYHQREVVHTQSTWMGVAALKNPLDAWIYQEILHEVRPEVVVEIGSAAGGGTLYLANLLDLLGAGRVISVDIDRSSFVARHDRITCFTGDSRDPRILAAVAEICDERAVLVIHDGDHRAGPVLEDLRNYGGLVSVGSYLIVEDGIIDLYQDGDGIGTVEEGPLVAVEHFLAEDDRFEIDERRERYLLTYNQRGYLRRER